MQSRDSLGRLTGAMLPQTAEGWIDRLVEQRSLGEIGMSVRKVIWNASDAMKKINKKSKIKRMKDPVKHAKILKQKCVEYEKHKEHYKEYRVGYYEKKRDAILQQQSGYYYQHHERLVKYQHNYYWNGGGREKQQQQTINNPSSRCKDSIAVELAMNESRKLCGNFCQWGGGIRFELCNQILSDFGIVVNPVACGKKANDVNHIFSRGYSCYINEHGQRVKLKWSEYEAELWNLIPLCFEHHILWHELKGDTNAVTLVKIRANKSGLGYNYSNRYGYGIYGK